MALQKPNQYYYGIILEAEWMQQRASRFNPDPGSWNWESVIDPDLTEFVQDTNCIIVNSLLLPNARVIGILHVSVREKPYKCHKTMLRLYGRNKLSIYPFN